MITFYKESAPAWGVDFCRAANSLFAARLAPVAPQGAIQTLGEHRSPCGELSRHARYGALSRGWVQLGILLLPLESDAARAPRRRAERRLIRPDSPQILTTIHQPKLFCQQR